MLKGHWLIAEQFFTPFHINTIKYDLFLFHILRLLHFSDNMNQPDKNDNNYDKLWKIRTLSDLLNDTYTKF